ncbi:MAG: zinc-binding protein [Crenarchaeota archaeon]|nr:zinc-binding protein [Thermoproteota archaeon]
MSFQEKSIVCCDCGATFNFSVAEQEFFATKGYTNAPKRCPTCRQARKQQQGNIGNSNGNYTRTSPRQMYPVVCAQCGKNTEVPFAPTSGRPVYCRECYNKVAVRA